MAKGVSSGEAIQIVAKAIREAHNHNKKGIIKLIFCDLVIIFEDFSLHYFIK